MLLTALRAGGSVSEKEVRGARRAVGGGYHRAASMEANLLNERRNIRVNLQTNLLVASGQISAADFSVGLQRMKTGM